MIKRTGNCNMVCQVRESKHDSHLTSVHSQKYLDTVNEYVGYVVSAHFRSLLVKFDTCMRTWWVSWLTCCTNPSKYGKGQPERHQPQVAGGTDLKITKIRWVQRRINVFEMQKNPATQVDSKKKRKFRSHRRRIWWVDDRGNFEFNQSCREADDQFKTTATLLHTMREKVWSVDGNS